MKRPLLIVALCYGAGIIAADGLPALPLAPLLASAILFAGTAALWTKARPWLIWVALFLTGASNLVLHEAILSPHDLRRVVGDAPQIVELKGTLCETPYQRVYQREEEQTWRTLAEVEVDSVRGQNRQSQTALGRVMVSTPGVLGSNLFAGRRIVVEGVLQIPRQPIAEELFDYRSFLTRKGIHYQLQVSSTNDWRLAEPDSAVARPLPDRFGDWARGALARGLPEEDEPLRLLWAMTLGWKTALNGEVAEPFMRSGTMHVFAISGLHIALIAGLLVMALRVARVPRRWCAFVVLPLIWQYTILTGSQASAVRSTIMMSVIIAGWSLRRPSDLLNSLAAAAFIILLWDPQQLFQAGFQLSFFVVLSLALFTPALEEIRRRFLAHDPFLPKDLLPAWRRWIEPPVDFVTTGLVVSLAAWLGSIPLIAAYFNLLTPVSLLANIVVVPLSSAALACNLASLGLSALVPDVAELFNHSAWFFMSLMVRLSHWAAAIPGGCLHVTSPTPVAFAFYYGLLVSLMAGWLTRPKLRGWLGGGLALLGTVWLAQLLLERSETRLAILPLSGGAAIYVQPAHTTSDLLIDCGNESAAEFALTPFLRAKGVDRLDGLLLTHGDAHHVGGTRLIREHFAVAGVYSSGASFRSSTYRDVLKEFRATPGLLHVLQRGTNLGVWKVLHPDHTDRFSQADDQCVVLFGNFDGVRVLLVSDLGKPGQNILLERNPDLAADIVVSGIPTRSEPLAGAFLERISPRIIVITDAEYPATQRAPRALQQRLKRRGVPVLLTRETGAVYLSLRGGRGELRTMNGLRFSFPLREVVSPLSSDESEDGTDQSTE